MNISPNYNVNYFRFNNKINHNEGQTEPQELKTPAFKMNKQQAAMTGAAALAAAVAGGLQAVKNMNAKEEETIPTREEFEKMLEANSDREDWLEAYDKDAKTTLAFYNIEDIDGNHFADKDSFSKYDLNKRYSKHPELVKQVVDTEDANGIRIFSFQAAKNIVNATADYPNGLAKMLSMKDDFGGLRFKDLDDYIAAEVFEKYPEEAEKYAMAKDEMGNYRFSGYEINKITAAKMGEDFTEKDPENGDAGYIGRIEDINAIIEAKKDGEIKAEDIDTLLNLKRNDGSFVFNTLPDYKTIIKYLDEPELFSQIADIRTPNRKRYVDNDDIVSLMTSFRFYPEETKCLLQMPSTSPYDSRFTASDIIASRLDAPKAYKNAPKAFNALASLQKGDYLNDGYRVSLRDIDRIIINTAMSRDGNINELSKEDMKAVSDLAKIRIRNCRGNWHYLEADDICKLLDIYKKYPQETKSIITGYAKLDEYEDYKLVIPDETDIEIFKKNPESMERAYVKRK